jgi:hypothetical protein
MYGSGVFCAWHTAIAWHNLHAAGIGRKWFPFIFTGAMAALFGAGLGFGLLRHLTGHVAGSIVAHWLLVSAVVVSLARRQRAALREPSTAGPTAGI